jgi:hypothetical protein
MQYLSSEYIEFNLVGQEENDHNITCKLRGGNALSFLPRINPSASFFIAARSSTQHCSKEIDIYDLAIIV